MAADPPPEATPPPSQDEEDRRRFLAELRRRLRAGQSRVAERFGVTGRDRVEIVSEMLSRQEEDRVSYWLRMVLALGISTLGLVLNSTGVVIGAMLISPLMEPIVALGMGLAIGSPYLTLRSAVRLGSSVVVVVGAAALLTLMLPFQAMTPEISARTSPTLIDLSIAGFCALAAGFTTVRRGSDTAAAAAGTAIGIALVPPVCVIGYGLGIGRADVAGGASLLFTANLCAIVFVTIALFFGLGFDAVDVRRLESTEVTATTRVAKIASRLRRAFGTRYGGVLRFLLPAGLVGAIFVPLRTALAEVAWQVRVRGDVEHALEAVAPGGTSVRTTVSVESHTVTIRLVIVGSPLRAKEIEETLRTEIAALAGVVPTVEVLAVPDYATLQSVAQSVETATPAATPAAAPTPPDLDRVRVTIDDLLAQHWPTEAGDILSYGLGFDAVAGPSLTLVHTGNRIGPVGHRLLEDEIGQLLGGPVRIVDRPIEVGEWTSTLDDLPTWVPRLAASLATARAIDGVRACVTLGPRLRHPAAPPRPTPPPLEPADTDPAQAQAPPVAPPSPPPPPPPPFVDPVARVVDGLLTPEHHEIVVRPGTGDRWWVRLTTDACPRAATPPSANDDHAPDAAADPIVDPAGNRAPAASDDL